MTPNIWQVLSSQKRKCLRVNWALIRKKGKKKFGKSAQDPLKNPLGQESEVKILLLNSVRQLLSLYVGSVIH